MIIKSWLGAGLGEKVADISYICLLAMAATNAFVIVIALVHQ